MREVVPLQVLGVRVGVEGGEEEGWEGGGRWSRGSRGWWGEGGGGAGGWVGSGILLEGGEGGGGERVEGWKGG